MRDTPNPPKWAARLLALALPRRDRDAVSGDLLEEYREAIVPAWGERQARRWYVRQVAAYASPLIVAFAVGFAHLIWNLYNSMSDPLGEDTIAGDLLFIAPLLFTPLVIGFITTRQSGHVTDAARTGMLAMLVLMAVGHVETFLRINLFLDTLQHRGDWVGLMDRYHASGFHSLRAFANYEYFHDTPILLGVIGSIGTGLSAIGGIAANLLAPRG